MFVCCCDDATKTRWKIDGKVVEVVGGECGDGKGRKRELSGWGKAGLSRLTIGVRKVLADLADLGDLGLISYVARVVCFPFSEATKGKKMIGSAYGCVGWVWLGKRKKLLS